MSTRKLPKIPLMLRMPPGVHAQIKTCAAENRRSLNEEIIYRLERSLNTYRR